MEYRQPSKRWCGLFAFADDAAFDRVSVIEVAARLSRGRGTASPRQLLYPRASNLGQLRQSTLGWTRTRGWMISWACLSSASSRHFGSAGTLLTGGVINTGFPLPADCDDIRMYTADAMYCFTASARLSASC